MSRDLFRGMVDSGNAQLDHASQRLAAWACWCLFFLPMGLGGAALLWFAARKHATFGISKSASPAPVSALSDEEVDRLQRRASWIAVILGALGGAVFLVLGSFGLGFLLFSKGTVLPWRIVIEFAILSGASVLIGLSLLRSTFVRPDTSWLLLLRVFTHLVARRFKRAPNSNVSPPETSSGS